MSADTLRVAIVGGAGYIGGETLRLLLGHPDITVGACTSHRLAGRPVDTAHPNLRSRSDLVFTDPADLAEAVGREPVDAVVVAAPHGEMMGDLARYEQLAPVLVDLSADFRLRDPAGYERYYGGPHPDPDALARFVPGLPELHRKELAEATLISVPGCMATAGILALHPLAAEGLIKGDIDVDARTGSSGSGTSAGQANLHAERSGAMRVFAPFGHRHEAEIAQATGHRVRMTATGVEAVRGVQVLCRAALAGGVGEREVRAAYRRAYADEPFVRVVAHKRGSYRLPEPKILTGSNFADVGFAVDPDGGHVLAVAALDNLVKGGAGNAVQSLNIRFGRPERTGLEFPGLHPV